jgi:protein TonB
LSLLFAFLSLTNRGNEGLVLTYRTPTIFRQPPSILTPPPVRVVSRLPAVSHSSGTYEPVIRLPQTDLPIDLPGNEAPIGEAKGPAVETPATAGPSSTVGVVEERVYTEQTVDEKPVAIDSPKPLYPSFPKDNGITGSVIAKVLVRPDGTVARVEVRGARLFLQTTQETLYRWRFRPARVQGKPVSVWIEVPVNFVM